MPSPGVPFLAGSLALLAGLLAIYFQPVTDFLLQRVIQYGLPISQPIVVDTARNITYRGSYSATGVEHFQNIFYAEDPSGPRRFAPPVPTRPSPGAVIDATAPGAWCPQGTGDVLPFTSVVANISENCLSLRVARSRGVKAGAKLPAVVWIHGGGHALGSASEILYHPDGLITQARADDQPLIYVAINYRLGLFGFASSEALVKAKHTNAGLRDQRAALDWVRDNIEAFGGDPNRVTAMGQSVGASDIGLHLTAFAGERGAPFQQAIMISGGPGLNLNTKSDFVAQNTAAIAKQVGCTVDDNSQSEKTLQCLREAPVEALTNLSVTAARSSRPPFGEGFFYPTYDGDFIRGRPSELMRAGKFVKGVPVIASWVSNDGAWYASPPTSTDEEVLASFGLWLFGLSEETKQRLLALYPLPDFEHMVRPQYDGPISAQYYRAAQMNRDIWFTCPVLDFAWQYSKHGGVASDQVRVYEHNATSDIPYVMNSAHLEGGSDNSAAQKALGRAVSRAIASFVAGGTPESTGEGRVRVWPGAFDGATAKEWAEDAPSRLTLQLFGGPYGTRPVTVSDGSDPDAATTAEKAVYWEKVLTRCEFINSRRVRDEAG
ncbi:hypothetical protein NUU61_008491, partial [Penicillium alfredii]